MAGGTGKDVFPKTPVGMKDVLPAEDVRRAQAALTEAINAQDALERSFLKLLFGEKWWEVFCGDWRRREKISNEFMLEFVEENEKMSRLRGQHWSWSSRKKGPEIDRKFLEKNTLLDPKMKKAKMELIDKKIRRYVLIIESKDREILDCKHRLNVLYSRLRIRGELRRYDIYAGVI